MKWRLDVQVFLKKLWSETQDCASAIPSIFTSLIFFLVCVCVFFGGGFPKIEFYFKDKIWERGGIRQCRFMLYDKKKNSFRQRLKSDYSDS